jgi:replicative superfamily II helicase
MLVNLQKRLKPKDDVRRLQLTDQYRELQKSPKSNDLNAWMTNWEKVYREGVKLTQPIVQKDTAVQDFLRAVFDIAPDFASFWTNTIQSVDNENAKPDLYTIIDRFRVQRQILRVETAESSSRSAFLTSLQEQQQRQQQGQQEEIQEKAPKKTDCLCGEPHRFKDCPYLIPGRQPQGWKPDLAIQERIETKMQNPRLKAAVDHARASQKEKGIPEEDIFGEVTF